MRNVFLTISTTSLAILMLAGVGCANTNSNEPVTNLANVNTVNQNVVTNDISANFGGAFTVQVNQTALVGGEVAVTVKQISNDSRCPIGAQCITAGTVSVVIAVAQSSEYVTIVGSGSGEGATPVTIGNYTITLGEVTPMPKTGTTIAPEDYTVTLTVEK
ncbi:MAG: hypothetical protein WCW27_02430 [Patescibacteria group bacterium]|jgi:hypothetical protein